MKIQPEETLLLAPVSNKKMAPRNPYQCIESFVLAEGSREGLLLASGHELISYSLLDARVCGIWNSKVWFSDVHPK